MNRMNFLSTQNHPIYYGTQNDFGLSYRGPLSNRERTPINYTLGSSIARSLTQSHSNKFRTHIFSVPHNNNQFYYKTNINNNIFVENRNIQMKKENFNFNKILSPDFDIENMIDSNNLTQLESCLEGLIYSEFSHQNNKVKGLIENFQQITEFLFTEQTLLEKKNNELESNYKIQQEESAKLDQDLRTNKDLIHQNKKQSSDLKYRLNLYKTIVDEYRGKYNTPNYIDHKVYFYCNSCNFRKFSTANRLKEHFNRRHNYSNETSLLNIDLGNHKINKNDPKLNSLMDSKMLKLKEELTSSITNFHQTNMNNLIENQNKLEKKIEDIKLKNYSENFCQIEKDFKMMMEELRTNSNSREKRFDHSKFNKFYETESKKMNEIIKEIGKTNDQKINALSGELNKFRDSIMSELKNMKGSKNSNIKSKPKEDVFNTEIEIQKKENSTNFDSSRISTSYRENHLTPRVKSGRKMSLIETKQEEQILINSEKNTNPKVEEIDYNSSSNRENNEMEPRQPASRDEGYLPKMRRIFNEFLKREETDLFVDNIKFENFYYHPINDVEISLKEDNMIADVVDQSLKRLFNSNAKVIKFKEIDSSDMQSIISLITKISQNSYEQYQKNHFYADYMDNIYEVLKLKRYMTDEKIISKTRREELFDEPDSNRKNNIKNENQKNNLQTLKPSLESMNTAKFGNNAETVEVNDF